MLQQLNVPMETLAKFSKATEITKRRIVQDFLNPKFNPKARHVKARNSIMNCLEKFYDMNSIEEGLNYINNKFYKDYWEKENSLTSLKNFKKTKFPFDENLIFEKIKTGKIL